jgi:hypothetical protein
LLKTKKLKNEKEEETMSVGASLGRTRVYLKNSTRKGFMF